MKISARNRLLLAAVGLIGIAAGVLLGGVNSPPQNQVPQALQITGATAISDAEVARIHQDYLDLQVWADVLNTLAESSPQRFHVYLESNPHHRCTRQHWNPSGASQNAGDADLDKVQQVLACASRAVAAPKDKNPQPWHTTLQQRSDLLWQAESPVRLLQVQISRTGYSATRNTNADLAAFGQEYQSCRNTGAEKAWLSQTPTTPNEETAALWLELQDHYRKCAARRSEERFPASHGFKKP